ncbi:mycofactocin-coupled SDR family oxidoreductase [Rhodococcus chondri]|uniref:Mycofactocin-coupled SDR family oxidoreductase n=1 Tax=Rhodococcus chondri TaxID=3065941 RepID=A0ABU7JY06_9NOCA|nr:mycofactocin-coupled SDR family oxidoreductase [Rhodococcus sp. CC-R104]MEE2034896.1 mycofactocin-coupled SDR family oxidoreductase [Rhodococcus sp. CC-R104]
MAGRVAGKVVFITGAARGQGRSHAVRLAEEGADIIAVDICQNIDSVTPYYDLASEADLDETVRLVEGLGRRIIAHKVDVRDRAGLQKALDDGISQLGGVDIVVANAGIATYGLSWELSEEQWRDMIDVNLTGVYNTAAVAIPRMIEAGRGGSIMFISSIGGLKGVQQVGHYVAAKHGIVGLMRTMANELGPHSIRVNTIHPTNVDTTMIQNPGTYGMFSPGDPEPSQEKAMPGFMSLNTLPIPWVDPVDISNAVLFLGSEEARYVTGVAFPVDAGAYVK